MKKPAIACNYAVVRFLPYAEAGEFVNVGVIVHSPTTGFFDFRVEEKRTRRIGGFFPELNIAIYRQALKNCEQELKRMRDEIGIGSDNAGQLSLDPSIGGMLFRELIRPRETIMRCGGVGTALTENPADLLTSLFERYVLRMFAHEHEYQEEVMQRKLTMTLTQHRLITRYREVRVGNDDYHVTFPFVYQPKLGLFARAIKPLNLGQSESTKIYDHGAQWVNRIQRLRKMRVAPEHILFPVHRPPQDHPHKQKAFKEVCRELVKIGAQVVPENDERAILSFARSENGNVVRRRRATPVSLKLR